MPNNNPPLFSVLIANYNNGEYLEKCLQSIFNQTYSNWEIVIVDDASTDQSEVVYEKYGNHSRITIIRNNKNRGCGYTKRKCVKHAKGDICGFVDPDDGITPDALGIMVKYHLANQNHSIIYSTHYICDGSLQSQKIADYVGQIPIDKKSWTLIRPIISHFATFKKLNYSKTNGISSFYQKAVDKDLYFKLEETGPVLFVDIPLYYYRHHASSISLNRHANLAYQYELTAKIMTIIRQRKHKKVIDYKPHTRTQFVKAIINVAIYEFQRRTGIIPIVSFIQSKFLKGINSIKTTIKKVVKLWQEYSH